MVEIERTFFVLGANYRRCVVKSAHRDTARKAHHPATPPESGGGRRYALQANTTRRAFGVMWRALKSALVWCLQHGPTAQFPVQNGHISTRKRQIFACGAPLGRARAAKKQRRPASPNQGQWHSAQWHRGAFSSNPAPFVGAHGGGPVFRGRAGPPSPEKSSTCGLA